MDKTEPCPYCNEEMHADWVDVGVGEIQCGPYHCESCGSSEIGPEYDDWCYKDREGRTIRLKGKKRWNEYFKKKVQWNVHEILKPNAPFTEEEIKKGFYKGRISPYANTVNGRLVDHKIAKDSYRLGMLDEKTLPFEGDSN